MYKNNNEKFMEDLKIAQKYEKWFAEKFLSKYDIVFNDDNKYDIEVLGKFTTFEIKHDYQSKTGNMAVEWECRGKLSGISVTQSTYFVYIYPLENEVWIIKTEKLKKLIKDFQYGMMNENWTSNLFYYDNITGGDVGPDGKKVSKLHLMKRDDIKSKFNVVRTNIPKY